MRKGVVGMIVLLFCLLVVMRGGVDIEQQAFVVSLGVDRESEGRIRLTVQLPAVKAGGGEISAGTGSTGEYEIVECVAANYLDAVRMLYAFIPREVSFSQLIQVVISEELAREEGFERLIDDMMIDEHIQQSAGLVITAGKARDFIAAQYPFLGVWLSRTIASSLTLFSQQGYIPEARLGVVNRLLKGGWRDVMLPYAAVRDTASAGEGGEGGMEPEQETESPLLDPVRTAAPPTGRPLDTQPGALDIASQNPIQYLGAALLHGGRMVGTLSGMETQVAAFFLGKMERLAFLAGDTYYALNQIGPVGLSVDQSGSPWRLRVTGKLRATAYHGERADAAVVQEAFHAEALEVLRKLQDMGADPVGFQGQAVRRTATLAQWEEADWQKKYQDAILEIQTAVVVDTLH